MNIMAHQGRSMAEGTPEGRRRKRKADATRGRRERASQDAFRSLFVKLGRAPTSVEVADQVYAWDPDLLPLNERKGAAHRADAR